MTSPEPLDPRLDALGRSQLIEVRVAVPDAEVAQRIAEELVARRLAACVQMLGPISSAFIWQGEVQRNTEWLLLVKSTDAVFPQLSDAVRSLHPYDVPEIAAVPVSHALREYAAWVWGNSAGLEGGDVDGGETLS